jgi:hypothetical protein
MYLLTVGSSEIFTFLYETQRRVRLFISLLKEGQAENDKGRGEFLYGVHSTTLRNDSN